MMSASHDMSSVNPQTGVSGVEHVEAGGDVQDGKMESTLKEPLTKQPDRVDSFEQGQTERCQSCERFATNNSAEDSGETSPDSIRREKQKKQTPGGHDEKGGAGVFFSGHFPWIHYGKKSSESHDHESSTASSSADDDGSLDRMVSQMFGERRKKQSEGYKTLHKGVIWKDLKVYGSGLGSAIQKTDLDSLLYAPKMVWDVLTFWNWRRKRQAQHKTVAVLHGFTVRSPIRQYAQNNY